MNCLSKTDQPRFALAMILRSAVIFLAIVALLSGQFAVAAAAAPMCDWAKSQPDATMACKSCCGKTECCSVNRQDTPQPARPPLASTGVFNGADLLAAITPALTAPLYVFPATEQRFVVPDTANRCYIADPLALICIRLI